MDVIFDTHGLQVMLNLDVRPILQLAGSLDSFFAERFHRIYVIDLPSVANFIWKAVKPVLPPKTREKIKFVSLSKPQEKDMLEDVCRDGEMLTMFQELLEMNRRANKN